MFYPNRDGRLTKVTFNFNAMIMTVYKSRNAWKIKLVTTANSLSSISRFATEWLWFWKDEHNKWNEYGVERYETLCGISICLNVL